MMNLFINSIQNITKLLQYRTYRKKFILQNKKFFNQKSFL